VVNKDYVLALTVLDEVGRNDKRMPSLSTAIPYDEAKGKFKTSFTQLNAEGIQIS